MRGFKYDFDVSDITLDANGHFTLAEIDTQNIALISLSQVCRITKPELGAQIGSYLINRHSTTINPVLARAMRMAKTDGARDVRISITDGTLLFNGYYEN